MIDLEVREGLCLLAVFLPGEGVILAQIAIENKQNEISAHADQWADLRNEVAEGTGVYKFIPHCQQRVQ